jgi:hypothetical protein
MRFYCLCLFRLLNSRGHTLTIDIFVEQILSHQNIVYKMFFYTFKGALNRTTITLYSMANIERAVKAVLAKRGLEYSLNKKTRHSNVSRPL